MVRVGPHFVLLRREPGQAWTVHRRYRRPDMPAALQLGMTVYTDYPNASRLPPAEHNRRAIAGGSPDLTAQFDYFRIRRPLMPAGLRGRALSDPSSVSDAELLAAFGEAADGR
jgi:hypothetical protein